MKAIKDLTREELLTFIINHPPGDVNIFDELAGCVVCEKEKATYGYECEDCINEIDIRDRIVISMDQNESGDV